MLCPKCNGELGPTSAYCPNCGAQIAPTGKSATTASGPAASPKKLGRWNDRLVIAGVSVLTGLVFAAAFGFGIYYLVRSNDGDGKTSRTETTIPAGSATSLTTSTTPAPEDAYPADPRSGGVLTFALREPDCLDPVNIWESSGNQVAQCLFDSLVAFDPKTGQVVPAAAASWETNADASVWTFHLVEGAKFHNGVPVTAADFKYAWERICDPANGSSISYHLSSVVGYDAMLTGTADFLEGVEDLDDYTLRVTLSYPFADFVVVAGHTSLAPVPRETVRADPSAFADMPIGNGPFMLSGSWTYGPSIDLVRFEDYYGDKAHLDGVQFQLFADEATAYLAFQDSELDFCPLPSGALEGASATYGVSDDGITVEPGAQVLTGPEAAVNYIFLNTADETLSNVKLRRALSLAVDRQKIADDFFDGVAQPATSIVPSSIFGYESGAWPYSHYDLAAAKTALADAGYPGGHGLPDIYLYVYTGASTAEQILTSVKDDLEAIGVSVVIQEIDHSQYIRRLGSGNLSGGYAGWIADYPSVDNFLYPLFANDSGDNSSFYDDPGFGRAIAEARATTDEEERVAKYQEVVRTVGDDAPVIPLLEYCHNHVGSERLRDFVYDQMGVAHLEAVWLENAGSTAAVGDGA